MPENVALIRRLSPVAAQPTCKAGGVQAQCAGWDDDTVGARCEPEIRGTWCDALGLQHGVSHVSTKIELNVGAQ
jgi:hypothetical protein